MLFSQTIKALAVFALLEASDAAPRSTVNTFGKGKMTLNREDTGRRRLRSGANAIRRAQRKYGVVPPQNMLYLSKEYGTVSATPESYDIEYLSPVQIGTPAKTLYLAFDTGSADLWVFSSLMPGNQNYGHDYYIPDQSSSSDLQSGQSFNLAYGDGSGASGTVYMDKVVVGPVTVTRQAVEAATSVSSAFSGDQDLDGIMGLGGTALNSVTPSQQWPFFQNVMPDLLYPIFCSYLKPGTRGAFDFGYLNSDHYSGEIHYTPADLSSGFWTVTASQYAVDYKPYQLSIQAIVDTGTSLLFLPEAVLSSYYGQVPSAYYDSGAGGWVFDCTEKLPSLQFEFGGDFRMIPGDYMNYSPWGEHSGKRFCYGGLQSSAGFPNSILGDIFIKSQYIVFDAGASRVGFANQT